MQMSEGAEIPELHVFLQKRIASSWPRLMAVEGDSSDVLATPLEHWHHAPGAAQLKTPSRASTPFTCAAANDIFCSSSNSCVQSCANCMSAPAVHSTVKKCTGPLETRAVKDARFVDEDKRSGM